MSLICSNRSTADPRPAAAGWLLVALLLGGCFLRADIPAQPAVSPTASGYPAAEEHGEKPAKPKPPDEPKPPDDAQALRELARHVDAADDPRFTQAAVSPSAAVRIESLRAWTASKRGPVPQIVVDLHYDDDPRVRAAALNMLATRKHPDALDYLARALHDVELSVRLAAVRGLGELDDPNAQPLLAELLKDRAELTRAEAVAAIALHGPEARVLAAAKDPSWRVRLKVAAALAGYKDAAASAAARRMLSDPGAEVQRQVVRSLASWPLESAVPVLLDALARDAVSVRKLAAEQLAIRWPEAGRFPYDAPPARRAEALAALRERYRARSSGFSRNVIPLPANAGTTSAAVPAKTGTASAIDQQVERLVSAGDFAALAALGPDVMPSLQRLAIQRHATLPEPVYSDVLPRYSPVFAVLDHMNRGSSASRRQAAEELAALARKQPIGALATARLSTLMAAQSDAAMWLSALEAVCDEAGEPAARMARIAANHNEGEVRRKACEYLAAHPDPANEPFLVPGLADPDQNVVLAAIRALGAARRMTDTSPLRKCLSSANEEIELAAAVALLRLGGDRAADDAIGRLSYSGDFRIRGRLAQDVGDLGDERFTAILIRFLDDSKATVSHAALASLSRVVGRDVAKSPDGTSVPISEQMARWKKWWADRPPHGV